MKKRSKTRTPAPGGLAGYAKKHCACCLVKKAEEAGCRLGLPSTGTWVAISGTKYQSNHNHAKRLGDHMVFWSVGAIDRVGVVELKSKNPSVGEVTEQLQNAAAVAERIAAHWPHDVSFRAVVLHKGINNSMAIRAFGKRRVIFRGKQHRILVKACGTQLASCY